MTTIQLKNGETLTHNHSDRMVIIAKCCLRDYFADGLARRSGDLEDDFTGQYTISLSAWKQTPFYPALAILVDNGEVIFSLDDEQIYWYQLKE